MVEASAIGSWDPSTCVAGMLQVYVAFDWGDEVDLDRARHLVPAGVHVLQRRRRTPTSIAYRPSPLRVALKPVPLELPELGTVQAAAVATVFDFAGVSVALQVPFTLTAAGLARLADHLAEPTALVQAGRSALEPLYQQLLPALHSPGWSELTEEYFVFHLPPDDRSSAATFLNGPAAGWLAGIVRLDSGPLSLEETAEALRLHLSYSPADLLVPDWAAAVLVDRDCDETLEIIEFANLQLLEFRHIDRRLDDSLAAAYGLVQPMRWSWLPGWRVYARSLRKVGELKVEANGLFERTGNVLKLVGDQYLARVYRLLATRFHLPEWEHSIRRSLDVAEGVYQVLSDQAANNRTTLLEVIVVILIFVEILLAVFRH
jgi:hypothetical protein